MDRLEKSLGKYFWLILVILSIPASWALLVHGFFGASDDLHIGWLYEMSKTISLGQIPPRFVPDLSYGFGYPLFNFVFPLPFYLGEAFHLMGLSLVDSVKVVFLISLPLSAISMYLLLREFTSPLLSLTGALTFIYTPYRSTEIYVRGAFGEALTFVFLPLLTLAVVKISKSEKAGIWIGVGALSLAGLILSHDITSYMFFPFVLLLAAILLIFAAPKKGPTFINLVLTFILGLLSSAYFWLPALKDSSLMKYDTVYNYLDHFPTLKQLIVPFFGYGVSVPGPNDTMSFFIGSINWVLFFIGASLLIFKWKALSAGKKVFITWTLVSFILAVFMMDFRSNFIWSHVPLLPYFQFPWRFLVITTFMSSSLVVALDNLEYRQLIGCLVSILVIILNWGFFKPHDFLGREDSYYVNKYIPIPTASDEYKKLAEEYLRLPKVTQYRPSHNYSLIEANGASLEKVTTQSDLNSQILLTADTNVRLNYNKYNFPGWNAKIDGKDVAIQSGVPLGQISIDVPSGQHEISIFFAEASFNKMLDIISTISVLVGLVLILGFKKFKIKL